MSHSSKFFDIQVANFRRVCPLMGVDLEEGPAHDMWADRNGATYRVDVEQGMVSGKAIECMCSRLGLDPIDFYLRLAQLVAGSEGAVKPS